MKKLKYFIFLVFFLNLWSVFPQEEVISKIVIKGNKKVSEATIISKIKIRAGQLYSEDIVNEDVKNLYATGFFEKVDIEKEKTQEGIILNFILKEKLTLKKIAIQGSRAIRKDRIRQAIDLKEGTFVDEYLAKQAAVKIKDLYKKRGFSKIEVDYKLKVYEDKNEVDLEFIINENRPIKILDVEIKGNKVFSKRKIVKLMKTKKNWLFNWSKFNDDVFKDDIKRIIDFYKSFGFSDVKVDYRINYEDRGVILEININEGRRYYVGEIIIEGNKNITLDEIKKVIKLKENFSEDFIYEVSSKIKELYVERGYIFCNIDYSIFLNPKTDKVDITYNITENNIAYVDKIDIRGNTKTKDKVIRRELRIYPDEKYDGKKVKKSKERLENLGFFEEIRFLTEPSEQKDKVNLVVDVKEAKTGYFSFGGGYSSINEFIGFIELRQRNFDYKNFSTFTGAGQDLSLYASLGSITNFYQLSFTNPWIFDMPVSFGFDVYKKGHSREEDVGYAYREDVTGGAIRFGREFNDYLKGQIAFRIDNIKITDIVEDVTNELKEEEGKTKLNSVELSLSFDTRDNVFSPLSGIYFPNTFQFTGGPFGGDRDFIKYFSRFSIFIPMLNKSVLELRTRVGIADTLEDTEKIPIYERFFAGGAESIRGYNERKVGPVDSKTNDPIGGEALFIGNIEYLYPLLDFFKIATFFDTGNVWKEKDDFLSGGFKSSYGFGIRVKTPIGPVKVDYGIPLDREPGKEKKRGKFHFSVSREF